MIRKSLKSNRYSGPQVAAIAKAIGVEIASETHSDLICYCPFHHNNSTPAFAISKEKGLWLCYRPDCPGGTGGTLPVLVEKLTKRTELEALRFIDKKGGETKRPLSDELDELLVPERMPILPQMKIDEFKYNLHNSGEALDYMYGRGFSNVTLLAFDAGYDPEKDMVVVPIHDTEGNPIGINGRSIQGKRFKLSKGIPRNKVLFNLHRAKRYPTVIFCESQFDVMRIHQAGFPNAVCSLGSHVSKEQMALLHRYFDRLIIMTDNDEAGRKTGYTLAGTLRTMHVEWAVWDYDTVYPHDAKDAGNMTDGEIKQCLNGAIPHFDYESMLDNEEDV